METRRREACRRAPLLGLLACALTVAGCGSKQSALAPHSKAAHRIASLWWDMLAGSALAFSIVALILLFAWARRRRPGAAGGRADRVAMGVVVGLGLVVPIAVLATLFIAGNVFLLRDVSLPTASASASRQPKLSVRVIGHQYWWEVRYPGTRAVTANEIHIPARTNVEVLLYSRDVIHSFWVPQLNKKVDLIPDQTNRLLLYADRPGRYRGQCAEYCGLQHAHMALYVYADPPARFRAWLARESAPARGSSSIGATLFADECGSCHTIRGTPADGNTGPDLTHVGSRTSLAALTIPNTPQRLAQWLRDPQSLKPGNQMPAIPIGDAEIGRLVSYLESLR